MTGVNMNYIVKSIIFLYLILQLIIGETLPYGLIIILLIITAINIGKEKYYDTIYVTIVTLLLTCAAVTVDLHCAILFALCVYDFSIKRTYVGIAAVLICALYYLKGDPQFLFENLILMVFSSLIAYFIQKSKQTESSSRLILDNERRLRYELEQAKAQLLHSSREIANITEVKERNRIARDIHDSIGHNIAGIFIQLQAAYKLHAKDEVKSMEIVKNSIDGLADSIELLRNTVHNLRPQEKLGVDYIRNIVDQYRFCPVELKLSGDFNSIPASHLELISTNIKEALTNSARYSQATKLDIIIDVNEQLTRLYMKDNGIGCTNIREGFGLSGMRERVQNIGGTISISANAGFLIVCIIPRQEGGSIYEGTHR
jgi:signal transduction histidine kinase